MKNERTRSIKGQVKQIFILMGVLFALLCVLINYSVQQILLSNQNEYTTITAQKLENQLSLLYDKMDAFSLEFSNEMEVQQFLSAGFPEKTYYVSQVSERIAYYKILEPDIVDISFVNEDMCYSSAYNHEELLELRQKNEGRQYSWLGARASSYVAFKGMPEMLLYGREVIAGGENVGTIVISINPVFFQLDNSEEMNSYYLLTTPKEMLISFNTSSDESAKQIWEAWKEKINEGEVSSVRAEPFLIQSIYSEQMGCYQLSALDTRQINQNMGEIRNLIWGSVVLVVGFMLLLLGVINIEVVKPLHQFYGIIRQIRVQRKRSLDQELHLKACAEIREIGDEFGGMLLDIEQLNRKIFETSTNLYEMEVQKQKAELSYMRSQVDPHFLYNTLEVFRKMALEKDAPEMAQMAVDMGNIFRYSAKGGSIVKLADEISIIKSYIRIQKTRFQGKIEVFYSLPKELLELQVMKMLLQPIVENAIYHGLEPKADKGSLFIGGRVTEDSLFITVKDDGVGIGTERLKEIERELTVQMYDTSKYVGIVNTQARIQLQYGKEYGLAIESVEGDGTTITLRIPVVRLGEKEGEYV